jgi:cyclin-D1-binding protein 1
MSSASSVQASLTLLVQTCALSIAAIRTNSTAQQLPLSSLRTDFLSLLSVIYSNTTKLSIALNPSSPAYSATAIPLKDLITHSSTLASNASSFLPNVHGRALTAEVHATAIDVLTAVQDLAHAHLSLLIKSASKDDAAISNSKTASDTYLAKTGVVHELIAQAKADHPQGLSRTNLIAVRKRWREHSDLVADAAAVLEIEADPPDDDDDDDDENNDDDFDDGWGDISDPGKQSPEQVELAKKVRALTLPIPHDSISDCGAPSPSLFPPVAHIVGRYSKSWNTRQRSLLIFVVPSCLHHVHQLSHRQTPC